jgi:hypothetical protein
MTFSVIWAVSLDIRSHQHLFFIIINKKKMNVLIRHLSFGVIAHPIAGNLMQSLL